MHFHDFLPVVLIASANPGCLRSQINSSRSPPFRAETYRSVSLRRLTARVGVPSALGLGMLHPPPANAALTAKKKVIE